MRAAWVGLIVAVAATVSGAAVVAGLSSNVTELRTQVAALEGRLVELTTLQTQVGTPEGQLVEMTALRTQVAALEGRLVELTTLATLPATSSGVPPPIPPDATTAKNATAESHLSAWATAYSEAVLALDRRNSLKRLQNTFGLKSPQGKDMGRQAAHEEVTARVAIQHAEESKAEFEAANK